MTKLEDVSKTNEEVRDYFRKWYEKNVAQVLMEWVIGQVGKLWVDTKMEATHFYSMLCFILLNTENREYILDYDDYVEYARMLNQDYPKGFYIHGYVKDDGKFHIWLEEKTDDSVPNFYYDNLFGGHVEVKEDE